MPSWLEQILGALLALFVLADVFLTVLYARLGSGIISFYLARSVWKAFRAVTKAVPRLRPTILSFCGPAILVIILLSWVLLLTLGLALVIHPALGTGVKSTSGSTSTDFISALYAGGGSISIEGANTFAPQTSAFRLLFLFNSLVGFSMISLTLTYLMQVYTALYRRNALAYHVYLASGETADAAELVAGIGAEGQFTTGYTILSDLATRVTGSKETHHFYPVLFYFRFDEPAYSVSRLVLTLLDAVTLIKAGLDDDRYGWLKESAPVAEIWHACFILVTRLSETFLPEDRPDPNEKPDPATAEHWRERFRVGLRRLREARIQIVPDEQAGAEEYVRLRACWHPHVRSLGPALGFTMEEVDPVGTDPSAAGHRPSFQGRRRSPG